MEPPHPARLLKLHSGAIDVGITRGLVTPAIRQKAFKGSYFLANLQNSSLIALGGKTDLAVLDN